LRRLWLLRRLRLLRRLLLLLLLLLLHCRFDGLFELRNCGHIRRVQCILRDVAPYRSAIERRTARAAYVNQERVFR